MLIKLTISSNGEPILINPEDISSVEANRKGPGSMIRKTDGQFKFVDESVDTIFKLSRGKLGPSNDEN